MAEIAGGGGGGGRTSFEGLTHEQMLAWLDQADKDSVKAAADRLSEAAFDIREIAQQLKFRPERVEWEGEGFQAFVDWGASLSSATFRLADYSDEASKAMTDAANVIAEVKSAIPRDIAGSKANLEAALEHRNDPDSDDIASKARADLDQKRHEAIAQMNKLAGAYAASKTRIETQELPTFQPPPDRFVPEGGGLYGQESFSRSGTTGGVAQSDATSYAQPARRDVATAEPADRGDVLTPVASRQERPVSMEIDSVQTLPPTAPTVPPVTPAPGPVRPETVGPSPIGPVGPSLGTGKPVPAATQNPTGKGMPGVRPPILPGQPGGPGPVGPQASRMPRDTGITGGRQVPSTTGKPAVGIPRTTVVGGESVHGRPPMAHGGGQMTGGMNTGQGAGGSGRRLAAEAGGIVGGRPQQPGAAGARPFTPGGSGLVRGATGGPTGQASGQPFMRGAAASTQGTGDRRTGPNGERPDYLVEDEETWQASRRVAPPVID
ncbi:hypothetical protein ABZ070_13525 [Streptomyces sp. NPDC006283]|uniref:hypothetical protein n=1 Tax=Streptomyces sp. NPDC006283 TaxID=3156741 RepID=UPI0033BFA83D